MFAITEKESESVSKPRKYSMLMMMAYC